MPAIASPTSGPMGDPQPGPAQAFAHDAAGGAARWQQSLQRFYGRVRTGVRTGWTPYYYKRIKHRLAGIVQPNSRVLDIGCADGELLASLRPSVGVGVDLNARIINEARRRQPGLRFHHMPGEDVHQLDETFDYVILSQTLGEIYDLPTLFRTLQKVCHARTRLVVVHNSRLWQPALKLMEWLRLKERSPGEHNWLPTAEVTHLLNLAGFETVRVFGLTIAPLYLPLVSTFLNRVVANLPWVDELGLNYIVVARPMAPQTLAAARPRSVSIIVPACNEAGNIRPLLSRIPKFAEKQEIIFVEGGSKDNTWEAIQDAVREDDGLHDIRCLKQNGKGKADAVRLGFAEASGDVLMILDADLSVPPEELPMFFDTLASGRGEFINGSRMVYLMDARAMRFLNLLGNKVFGAIFTYLLSQRFRDTLCGTKVLTRADYLRIRADRDYFGDFDPFGDFELLFGAARLNLKIVDVPVHYQARTYGQTNISRFRHGWILLRMCWFAAGKIKFL
ncbi:MAG: glycosyltransferase [Planctomycetes bacterium]|nr:glycosyltransferase [Planctomycetota bacterium]